MAADLQPGPESPGAADHGLAEPPVPGAILRLDLHAAPVSVRHVLQAVLAHLAGRLTEGAAGTLQIVLAEVLNNIVEHAYGGAGGRITLQVSAGAGVLTCRVADQGRAMPGGALPDPASLDFDLDDLPEGGFGWLMIRDLAQDLHYRRDRGHNILQFRISLD